MVSPWCLAFRAAVNATSWLSFHSFKRARKSLPFKVSWAPFENVSSTALHHFNHLSQALSCWACEVVGVVATALLLLRVVDEDAVDALAAG